MHPPVPSRPSEPTPADLEVVLVSYRSRGHVQQLLDGWPGDLPVTLVDNSANVDGIAELARTRPGLRYVDGGGQGFARSANLGARRATAPYVVFVNPDSRPTAEQLARLVEGLRDDPSAAAYAGTPAGRDGAAEIGAAGWEPSVRRLLVYATGLQKVLPRSGFFARPAPGEELAVDWVCGACLAVRRDQFLELGGFDEAFYVYAEDMSFGRRAREHGLRSVLRTDVVVPHGAGSSGAPSQEMLRLRGASFAGYLKRYHPGPAGVAMRAAFAAGALARGAAHRLRRDRATSRLDWALTVGTLTQRAYVGGQEVARSRFRETEPAAPPAPAEAGPAGGS